MLNKKQDTLKLPNNLNGTHRGDDSNNGGSDYDDAELEEFCETSSWETSSARSQDEEDRRYAGNKSRKSMQNDSQADSNSEESLPSEKMAQDKWEEHECDKFIDKWIELNKEISNLEK